MTQVLKEKKNPQTPTFCYLASEWMQGNVLLADRRSVFFLAP